MTHVIDMGNGPMLDSALKIAPGWEGDLVGKRADRNNYSCVSRMQTT